MSDFAFFMFMFGAVYTLSGMLLAVLFVKHAPKLSEVLMWEVAWPYMLFDHYIIKKLK